MQPFHAAPSKQHWPTERRLSREAHLTEPPELSKELQHNYYSTIFWKTTSFVKLVIWELSVKDGKSYVILLLTWF